MSEEKQHKRRVHYSGKYPKKFEEKYKELNPEKYKDTIVHARRSISLADDMLNCILNGKRNHRFSGHKAGTDRL